MASSNTPASNETTIASGGTWPVGQRASANQAAVVTTGAVSSVPWGFSTSTQANAVITLVNELRASCIAAGIIKGSA
jgi:hypothetical protein